MNPKESYQNILELVKETKLLESISYLLQWDQDTYMPEQGIGIRSMQSECIASLKHQKLTSNELKSALEKLIHLDTGEILDHTLSEEETAVLKEVRRDFQLAAKLPNSFVKKMAHITSKASHSWISAKKGNDFEAFSPHLTKIVDQCKEQAELLGYKEHPYDALIDLYEPGMTTKKLQLLFKTLKPFLIDLTKKLTPKKPLDTSFLFGDFSSKKQMKLSHDILELMGIDFKKARLDRTAHPFCVPLHPQDIRLTTHDHSNDLMGNISAIMHEGGHGLYEMGFDPKNFGSPLAEAVSLGMHESQSRWWETFIGQSQSFCHFLFPTLQKIFPEKLSKIDSSTFYKTINRVTPTMIRVHSDEVTYILHVILRFELEVELIEGKLQAHDIPEAWNAKMQELFGITPKNDQEGCLQDVHWSLGMFGYFPTYALGNLYAAQIFATFKKEHPEWEKEVSSGNLLFIRDFLQKNIHQYGRQYSSNELLERITKEPLSPNYHMKYLEQKYTKALP
ncbi:MAG: carboxypeptidase M32 [Simkaniaceae bacterium]|nr:carboxypeptidase M32 [Simkaniaceae bacterium]